MLGLLRSGSITSFTKGEGPVTVIYANNWEQGQYVYKARFADPEGYLAYTTAAQEASGRYGLISYHDQARPDDTSWAAARSRAPAWWK